MQPNQAVVPVIHNTRLNNGTAASQVIDLQGHNYCTILFQAGSTDVAATTFKLTESDTKADATSLTSGADVTGLTLTMSATSDHSIWAMTFPTAGRKRYVLPVLTVGNLTGVDISAMAIFHNSDTVKPTATGLGLAGLAVLPTT